MHAPLQTGHLDAAKPARLDRETLLDTAHLLQRAARAGGPRPLLRGKKLGLLHVTEGSVDAQNFCSAADELGAHVALIRSAFTPDSAASEVQDTARLLGRLYDAVECQGLPASLVDQLATAAGIPVYDGLASPSHASADLARQLAGDEPLADRRRYIVQAVLLATII
jgi:ornithine carbamoyltransferase